MSISELNDFYKNWLTNSELSDKNQGCLGLIDIARKTGNVLEYDFEDIDDEYSYFSLRTVVKT
jgi:hypothetical protein